MNSKMDKRQVKDEIATCCFRAIKEYLASTRGAAALGAGAEAKMIGRLIEVKSPGSNGPVYFTIEVKESIG